MLEREFVAINIARDWLPPPFFVGVDLKTSSHQIYPPMDLLPLSTETTAVSSSVVQIALFELASRILA